MSISDMIVVMKEGRVQQIGKPQTVYDDPVNLFVAKFLGTPPINVFSGCVKDGVLYIGNEPVLDISGVEDREVYVGVRPEGFVLDDAGALTCRLSAVEVMGRDTSVVSYHDALDGVAIRSIIPAEDKVDTSSSTVRFNLKPFKVHIFDKETEERIYFTADEPSVPVNRELLDRM